MRLFERAIARSGLPVRFSEGFNPRPRFSLPLPRAVGVATTADVLVIELAEPLDPDVLLEKLSRQMPGGLRLQSARRLEGSASLQPLAVTCECPVDAQRIAAVQQAIAALLDAPRWMVTREAGGDRPGHAVDLRALLVDASTSTEAVRWTVRVTNDGTIRPAEFLSAVGLDARTLLHRVRRVDVEWSQGSDDDSALLATAQTTEA